MKNKLIKSTRICKIVIFNLNEEKAQECINKFLATYPEAKLLLVTDNKMIFKYKGTLTG